MSSPKVTYVQSLVAIYGMLSANKDLLSYRGILILHPANQQPTCFSSFLIHIIHHSSHCFIMAVQSHDSLFIINSLANVTFWCTHECSDIAGNKRLLSSLVFVES